MSDAIRPGPGPLLPVHNRAELRKEAYTMALYVAICLLAALSGRIRAHVQRPARRLQDRVGHTVGLAVAHWLAFRVSARLVASGAIRRHDAEAAGAQLAGAVAVGLLATVPVVVLPDSVEFDVVRLVLAGFIALVGYTVARSSGATRARSIVYAGSILVIATAVAVVKNLLAGH